MKQKITVRQPIELVNADNNDIITFDNCSDLDLACMEWDEELPELNDSYNKEFLEYLESDEFKTLNFVKFISLEEDPNYFEIEFIIEYNDTYSKDELDLLIYRMNDFVEEDLNSNFPSLEYFYDEDREDSGFYSYESTKYYSLDDDIHDNDDLYYDTVPVYARNKGDYEIIKKEDIK